jgi:hypothetical protein
MADELNALLAELDQLVESKELAEEMWRTRTVHQRSSAERIQIASLEARIAGVKERIRRATPLSGSL